MNAFDPDREYAFIGDIHGQAKTLLALLDQLGWTERSGRLRHHGGQFLVFVGDLVAYRMEGPGEVRRDNFIVQQLVR